MGKEITVTIDGKAAGRVVGLERLAEIAARLGNEPEVFVVYDENASWVASEVVSALPGIKGSIAIDASEEEKSMETVLLLCRSLMEAGASRKELVLAIGGGITTDLAGFAASIYKRGVRYANLPTTLLAQVDAAIGGKTGVNFDDYKNMLGVIVQPVFTFICAEVLHSLPHRDFLSGAAETQAELLSNPEAIVVTADPAVTAAKIKNENVKTISVQELLKEAFGTDGYAQAGLFVRADTLAADEAGVKAFLDAVKDAAGKAETDVKAMAEAAVKLEILPNAKVAEAAIPGCSIRFTPAAEAREAIEKTAAFDLSQYGGEVPADEFYYTGE